MSDFAPSTATRQAHAKRPVYLLVALLFVWAMGLLGAARGCQTIQVLREPESLREAASRLSSVQARQAETHIETVLQFRNIETPLAVGKLLLASLLTLSAGLSMVGRSTARKIALQAMVAYALFLPFEYVTQTPIRAALIEALTRTVTLTPLAGVDAASELTDPASIHRVYVWAFRLLLALQLAIIAAGFVALTRPRARAFFGAVSEGPPEEP